MVHTRSEYEAKLGFNKRYKEMEHRRPACFTFDLTFFIPSLNSGVKSQTHLLFIYQRARTESGEVLVHIVKALSRSRRGHLSRSRVKFLVAALCKVNELNSAEIMSRAFLRAVPAGEEFTKGVCAARFRVMFLDACERFVYLFSFVRENGERESHSSGRRERRDK